MSDQTLLNKEQIKEQVLGAMNFRHATKEYDANRNIPDAEFRFILEAGRLSPSSLGSEPWKFLIIQNPELRKKLMKVAGGAVKKLQTASHFVIILARKDVHYDSEYLFNHMRTVQHYPEDMLETISEQYKSFQEDRNILDNQRTLHDWSSKQTYIALGNMLTTAAMIGIDSSPMEGFHTKKLDAVLEEEGLLGNDTYSASVLAAFGYRKANPKRGKTRKPLNEVVEWV